MQVSWDTTWFDVASVVAKRSRCTRAQVGAVIVDTNKRVVATGYNGPAVGYPHSGTCENYCERAKGGPTASYASCPSIHAEANALLYVDRSKVEGGTIYSTHFPCMDCAKLISNSGVSRLVSVITEKDAHRNPEIVLDYLTSCGIEVKVEK